MKLALALAAGLAAPPALACGPGIPVTADGLELAYRIEPVAAVGRMVAVEIVTCGGLALAGFDARMPIHGHGLNYRPRIAATGPGAYRIDGVLFHMPGPWQFVFDVRAGETARRLTSDLTIRR